VIRRSNLPWWKHPSIYIIDRVGIVRFVEVRQNYFFRVKMSTILDDLKKTCVTD